MWLLTRAGVEVASLPRGTLRPSRTAPLPTAHLLCFTPRCPLKGRKGFPRSQQAAPTAALDSVFHPLRTFLCADLVQLSGAPALIASAFTREPTST